MAKRRLIRIVFAALPPLALAALLLAALLLAGDAETDEGRLGRWSPWLFAGALIAVLVLLGTIARQIIRIAAQWRERTPGARLAARLTLALVLLAVPPVLLVYGFALKFLHATIDSWFNVRIEQALDDALALGQLYIDDRLVLARGASESLAREIDPLPEAQRQAALDAAIDASGALQLAVFGGDGTLRANAAADPRFLLPTAPESSLLLRLRDGGTVAQAEPAGTDLVLRVLVRVGSDEVLQTIHPLPGRSQELAQRLEASYYDFQRLAFLRDSLKLTFTLILTAVLLLSVLAAVLAALAVARRQVKPITRLAEATRAIAAGRFDAQVPAASDDELGFLAGSFNRMALDLGAREAELAASRADSERQRIYLEAVLGGLSAGVVTVDAEGRLRTANPAASAILGLDLAAHADQPLQQLAMAAPRLAPLVERAQQRRREGARDWREELRLGAEDSPAQVLMLRGAELPDAAGQVLVFDDLTVLNQAQRDAAWSEVAQRLAHEVKNPLTPIQLAAERLHHRLAARLSDDDRAVLEKSTRTIVAQVDALKTMVNAFGEYARTPQFRRAPVNVNALLGEVMDLYEQAGQAQVARDFEQRLPPLRADAGRLRQLLHNLVKNAIEAKGEERQVRLEVSTRRETGSVALTVADDGPGLPPGFDASWFEPYTTTKPRGTGLGLAIVKRIAEEHGGAIEAANRTGGGAAFTLRLPVEA